MFHYEPKDLNVKEVHRLLIGGVGPRPIALVSTLSEDGIPNLSPFSFFNVFGANPPVLAFSPSRRGRDKSFKDTYNNLIRTKECVVQVVTFPMIEQVNLASAEYPSDVNEFLKSGLTPLDSDIVKPKRVKESPFQMECKLLKMESFGEGGSSANISICEIVKFHISEDIFKDGIIHPELIDLVGRMSADFYTRAKGFLFETEQPRIKKSIGYDSLPESMKKSNIYSANDLGRFATIEKIPNKDEVNLFVNKIEQESFENFESSEEAFYRYKEQKNYRKMFKAALNLSKENHSHSKVFFELTAKTALDKNDIDFAWNTIIYADNLKL
ncbi:MAG: flavin reductase family protein [Ignavibacteriaceae bacterium]